MKFNQILRDGVRNINNINDLHSYLIREYKKAERDFFYTPDPFFSSLINTIEKYKSAIVKQYNDEVKKMQRLIEKSGNNGYDFKDEYYGRCLDKTEKSYEDFKAESNNAWFTDTKNCLSEYHIDKVKIGVDNITMKDIMLFESAINSALKEIKSDKGDSETPALEAIFDATKLGYNICLKLFKELEFVDENGKTINKKAGDLMGLIDALNAPTHNLIKDSHKYSYDQLMQVFQLHLKIPFTPNIKRRGKGFENVKEKALIAINSYIKKARVS